MANNNVNTTYNFKADKSIAAWLVLDNYSGFGFQQVQTRSLTTTGTVIGAISKLGSVTYPAPEYLTLIKCKEGDELIYSAKEGLEWNGGINGYVHFPVYCRIFALKVWLNSLIRFME